MTERPIPFRDWEVRAILEGRKTQTRRFVKPQPPTEAESVSMQLCSQQTPEFDGAWQWWAGKPQTPITKPLFCPYGQPGDLLWVRETWAPHPHGVMRCGAVYRADPDAVPDAGRWRPSIHMPRWASRITLRITGVRVERLQDISEDDARAEGATMRPACNGFQHRYPGWSMDWSEVGKPSYFATGAQRGKKAPLTESDVSLGSAKWAFASLWNRINGPDAWEANPWVWVIEFERVKP